MGAAAHTLEDELVFDLQDFSGQFGDEQLCLELYRALTRRALTKEWRPGTTLVLSWHRAAEFVNELREREEHAPLPLAGAGSEGVVSERVSEALEQHGWRTRALT